MASILLKQYLHVKKPQQSLYMLFTQQPIRRRSFSNNKKQKKKSEILKSVRGTTDIFSQQSFERRAIIDQAINSVKKYGYNEIQTPTIEYTDVFTKSLGTTSDIISKEMFTWEDSKGRNISLRPENTASIARAMISSGRIHNNANLPERLYYHGSMFRRERPQKGRLREFTQFGVESIGTISTHEDIDVLSMANRVKGKSSDLIYFPWFILRSNCFVHPKAFTPS